MKTLPTAPDELGKTFRANYAQMLQAAHRVTGNAQDAEDVLQTVFLRLVRREAPIALSSDEGSYLRRAAVNSALDLVRARRRTTVIPFDQAATPAPVDGKSAQDSRLATEDLREWLRDRIGEMSPMAAEAFALRYFEEFSNQEIADVLGTSQNSIAVTLHRTRKHLSEQLREATGEANE